MKIKNKGDKDIPIRFPKISSEGSNPPTLMLAPNQVVDIPPIHWDVLKKQKKFERLLAKGTLEELEDSGDSLPGDGDPNCEFCYGRGFITVVDSNLVTLPNGKDEKARTPTGRRCRCVLARDVLSNVRKIWPGVDLMKAPRLPEPSPLRRYTDQNVWITAKDLELKAHLRHVALRMGPKWFCRVRSDSEMMAGWLASAKAKSIQIFDVDVAETSSKDMDLHDLADAPDLLIMILGVKRARNNATPETLMEVLAIREYLDKPTWVVDQPSFQIDHESHRCNSPEVLTKLMDDFKRVPLNAGAMVSGQVEDILFMGDDDSPSPPPVAAGNVRNKFKLSPGSGSTTTQDIVETVKEDDWKKKGKKR